MNVYRWLLDDFRANFSKHLSSVDVELVVNDESSLFTDYNNPFFNYPFEPRRSIINSYPLHLDDVMLGSDLTGYNYTQVAIDYQLSQTCLEAWGYLPDANGSSSCKPG